MRGVLKSPSKRNYTASVLEDIMISNALAGWNGLPALWNREDDPQYIVKLIGKVITVSLETMEIVEDLPRLESPEKESVLGTR